MSFYDTFALLPNYSNEPAICIAPHAEQGPDTPEDLKIHCGGTLELMPAPAME